MSDEIIDQLFREALLLSGAKRSEFLSKLTPDCRTEIERLLQADDSAERQGLYQPLEDISTDEYSDAGGGSLQSTHIPPAPSEEDQPARIGNYKILQLIGEGGMGSVYMAEQTEPVKRRVALKVIKAGMGSKEVIARFEAERQALAMMDHPNIAKVLDAGVTNDRRPYFVMEYVKGVAINRYCDDAKSSLPDRLQLFVQVCRAIQHAHHKGIIHRDLKPSNILICLYDGVPMAKVIDFGLAKAMHQPLTEKTLFTRHGLMVGTPLYMSPEQAEVNNLDVDTRTDIYSLGVVLYELLSGTTPLEREQLNSAAYNEILRLIKEVEPIRPSLRLSGSETLPSVAAHRNIDPRTLTQSLAGELDWIVLKALEKERSRRYDTANDLARDVERFLNDETVEATPPSFTYRLRKFTRRHRPQVIAATLLLGTLLLGIAGTTWGLLQAQDSEQEALEALADVKRERDAKNDALAAEKQQREATERELIAGILRPIGIGGGTKAGFNDAELKSFVDWSRLPNRLKVRVLERAFEDPATALRVARRAERAIQASVGMSPSRRAEANALLLAKQNDLYADARIRVAACWLALAADANEFPALGECAAWARDSAEERSLPDEPLSLLFTRLWMQQLTVSTQSTDRAKSKLGTQSWNPLISLLQARDPNRHVLQAALVGFEVLSPNLSTSEANTAVGALLEVLGRSQETEDYGYANYDSAAVALTHLAPRLNAQESYRVWRALSRYSETNEIGSATIPAVQSFRALVSQLPDQVARSEAASAMSCLAEGTEGMVYRTAVKRLAALVPRLDDDELRAASHTLLASLRSTADPIASKKMTIALDELLRRLSPPMTTHFGDVLVREMQRGNTREYLGVVVKSFVVIAPTMKPDQFAGAWDTLVTLRDNDLLASAIRDLVPTLTGNQIDAAVHSLTDCLNDRSTQVRARAIEGLCRLGPKLDSRQVQEVWARLIDVLLDNEIDWTWDFWLQNDVDEELASLVARLNEKQVSETFEKVSKSLSQATVQGVQVDRFELIATLTPKLESSQRTAALTLLLSLMKKDDLLVSGHAAETLADLAPLIAPSNARGAWNEILQMFPTENSAWVAYAPDVLVAVAPSVGRQQVSACWVRLMEALNLIVEDAENDHLAESVCRALLTLAPRAEPSQRSRSCDALITLVKSGPLCGTLSKAEAEVLAVLLPDCSEVTRKQALQALFETLDPARRPDTAPTASNSIVEIASGMGDSVLADCNTRLLELFLDICATDPGFFADETRPGDVDQVHETHTDFLPPAIAITNPRRIAQLLSHPGCVAESQAILLKRFEELVLHNGKRVFLFPKQENAEFFAVPAQESPERKFVSIYDASRWIDVNWPDFDLEAAHRMKWQGK